MDFSTPLLSGTLIRRYQRFKVDVLLETLGEIVTAHCPNTGAMLDLIEPGARVFVKDQREHLTRTLPYSLEIIESQGTLVGVNTSLPNRLVAEFFKEGRLPFFSQYDQLRPEVKVGSSRLDGLLSHSQGSQKMYLEIKNAHYKKEACAFFPDSVTQRGAKHINLLSSLIQEEQKAMVLYVIQRSDVEEFRVADFIDPVYGKACQEATQAGVLMKAITCLVSPKGIEFRKEVPVLWS